MAGIWLLSILFGNQVWMFRADHIAHSNSIKIRKVNGTNSETR
jgi:hypothetical protein